VGQLRRGQPEQFVVDQRKEALSGVELAAVDGREDVRHGTQDRTT
jgi:hypothetical protein